MTSTYRHYKYSSLSNVQNIQNFTHRVKGFFYKKNNTPTNRKIFFLQTLNPFPTAPDFRSKSRIYKQLDTHAPQRQQYYNLHIFGIDFFFRPPYIVLEVVNENLFDVLVELFCRGQTKHVLNLIQ